jgi:hypothetical protein
MLDYDTYETPDTLDTRETAELLDCSERQVLSQHSTQEG